MYTPIAFAHIFYDVETENGPMEVKTWCWGYDDGDLMDRWKLVKHNRNIKVKRVDRVVSITRPTVCC